MQPLWGAADTAGGAKGGPLSGRDVTRFLTVAALTLAMVLVAVQSLGILFLTDGAPDLLLLCAAAGLCSLPVILSRLPDWACWLMAQLFAAMGALWLADRPVGLTAAIRNLPNTGLTLALPGQASSRAIALNFGGHDAVWMLLLLLGLLTWELTWGVLWLVLRAGYVWPAIVLAGANLLTAASVGTDAQARFLPFALLALLLVLWHTWSERWTRAGAEPGVRLPFRWAAVSLLGGLCLLGLALPLGWALAPSLQNGHLRQWATERWTRLQPSLVNPLHLSPGPDAQTLDVSGFGNQVALDGPFRPFPGVIMRVQGVPPDQGPYWRGQVYGEYSGGAWRMAGPSQTLTAPSGTMLPANVPRHDDRLLTVHITVTQPADGLLFAPGRPVAAGVPGRAVYPDPDVSGSEPGAVYADQLRAGEVYTIVAEAPFATPRLGAAGPPPDPRYMVIPPGLDPRLGRLALKLTAGQADPLAKARAITNYLRGPLFTYDSSVGAPSNGQDPLTYFLFTSRRGYCVHFASSMALLARLAGLPSRVVGGYATGAYENGAWVVRGENAHTWPEIFFTGVGWVPFEPTPGFVSAPIPDQSVVGGQATAHGAQPSAQPTKNVPLTPLRPAPHAGSSSTTLSAGYPLLGGLIAVLALGLVGGAAWLWALRRRRPTIAGIYRRLCRTATLLAHGPRPWHTPFEFAHFYAGRSAEEYADITRITTLYAVTTYGHLRAMPNADELAEAREALRRLRRRWLARKLHLPRS